MQIRCVLVRVGDARVLVSMRVLADHRRLVRRLTP